MKKLSLEQKAKKACGKSQACTNCKFCLTFNNDDVCDICRKSFIEGYLKGYKRCKKDMKEE